MLYFAYGSNMLEEQITNRTPSAKYIDIAKLIDMKMVCNKFSTDGSGKANIVYEVGSVVCGVLFEIPDNDLIKLNNFEKSYTRIQVRVSNKVDQEIKVECNISANYTNELPFESYKAKIIKGAIEHNLPHEYIYFLNKLPSKPDLPNSKVIKNNDK